MTALAPTKVGWCPGALRPMETGDGLVLRVKPRGGILRCEQAIALADLALRFGNGSLDLTSRANLQIRGVAEEECPSTHPLMRPAQISGRDIPPTQSGGGWQPKADGWGRRGKGSVADDLPLQDLRSQCENATPRRTDPTPRPSAGTLPCCAEEGGSRQASREPDGSDPEVAGARGVRFNPVSALTQALADLDLLDADAEAEAVRNIVVSPSAGLDASVFDVNPIVRDLEHLLATDPALRYLPAKWSIVVDDGGPFSLATVAADLRFEADPDSGTILIGLANDPARASCAPKSVAEAMARLCRLVLHPRPRRMTDAVREWGTAALFSKAGLPLHAARRAPTPPPRRIVGQHHFGGTTHVGVAAPFGGLRAEDFRALAQAATDSGAHDLRLTPWRAILVTGLSDREAARFPDRIAALPLIVDPDDPRLVIAACRGAPECHRGSTATHEHAAMLAASMRNQPSAGIAIHVSGCAKGCAHAGAAPWTLVGHDGLYDIVRDGKADATPVRRAVTFQEAALWLSREPHKESA